MEPLAPVVAIVRFCGGIGKDEFSAYTARGGLLSIAVNGRASRRGGQMRNRGSSKIRRTAAQMHALAAVRRDIGRHDASIRSRYLREFHNAFRTFDKALDPEEMKRRVQSADILLVGDYHALPASQKFAADLTELLAQSSPVVLSIEAVLTRDQHLLDAWWRRELGEQALRQRLRFDREWGYDWSPFYELLVTAREHAEGIYALDCDPRDDLRKIRSRDRHAAAKIRQIRGMHPGAKIVVLFGESHMAPQHLPATLRKEIPGEPVITILQNIDSIYWKAAEMGAKAVAIGDDAVCVFNSSPLEKYESYRICLERWSAGPDEGDDFAPAVHNVIVSLARTLGFRLDSPTNGTQPRFLADSLPEVVTGSTTAPAKSSMLESSGCSFAAETNRFYIHEFRMAAVAAEAARFLYSACRGKNSLSQELADALAHFGARLLCPESLPREQAPGGEALYRAYIAGALGKNVIRRLFLGDEDLFLHVKAGAFRFGQPSAGV
jgi:hypothetical protein